MVTAFLVYHGSYDHIEREFRGFGKIEQTDSEIFIANTAAQLFQAPAQTKIWVHTGSFNGLKNNINHFAHEYWFEEMTNQGFPVEHSITL